MSMTTFVYVLFFLGGITCILIGLVLAFQAEWLKAYRNSPYYIASDYPDRLPEQIKRLEKRAKLRWIFYGIGLACLTALL